MKSRTSKINRETNETSIRAVVNLDGTGKTSIQTGISSVSYTHLRAHETREDLV